MTNQIHFSEYIDPFTSEKVNKNSRLTVEEVEILADFQYAYKRSW